MVDVKISALGAIGTIVDADVIAIIDDVANTPVSKKATMSQIKTYIDAMTASSTATFTNKTFDVEGTGNSISNIDVADLKSGVLDTDISTTSASDDTIPSAKAVKTAIDAKASTVSELTDTTISSVGDNELLQYDSTSSKWINQTLAEAGIQGTLTFGIGNGNVIKCNANVADDDFLRIDGTTIEGRTVAEVKSDLSLGNVENTAISTFAGSTNIVTTGALNSGSITSGFGNINNGASTITTTGAVSTGALTSTQVDLTAQGELRLQDASGGQYIGFKAPTTVTDYTLTMPGATGAQGEVLKMSSTANTLEWGTAGGGNHTEQGFDVYTTHTPTSTTSDGIAYMFARKIDSNNDGLYITLWKNGASREVQIA
jgi:hypothetical protein